MITPTFTRLTWSAPDGELFPYSAWEPESGPPRAVVIAVHGLSGAALDYEPLGSHLVRHGVITYALELRGQGNDPKPARRGDLRRIEQWYDDLRAFFALVRERHPGASVFCYGESMGAALLVRFLAQAGAGEQPQGLILASPVVAVPGNPGWWRRFIFHTFLLLTPGRRINVAKYTNRRDENDPKHWITRDETHRRWFQGAPHRITSFTFRFFKCVFELFRGCDEAAPRITVPVLVMYAANDVFIRPAQVEAFFARLGSADKERALFPESFHLLLHDFDKDEALARVEGWLLSRIEEA